MPEYPNSDMYCDTSEPFTSVKIRRRSGIVNGANEVMDGSRPTNSGINLHFSSVNLLMQNGTVSHLPKFDKIYRMC